MKQPFSQTTINSTTTNSSSSSGASKVSHDSQFSAASGGYEAASGRQILPHPNLRGFYFAELKTATRNFRSDTVLGEGGFGKVYKGWLEDRSSSRSTVVAVKKLNSESMQGLQEWQVIYRDFKASNILLDGSYNAKISDFGLAKVGPSASQSHVTTRVMGTYGYAAPEYVSTGHLYVKSDVYGFGIVLVEMLTGLRALDTTRPAAQHNLSDWVKPYLADRRKLKNIMDSRLEGRYPSRAAVQIAQLALTCIGPEPKTRPSMKEVVEKLEQLDAVNERPKVPRVHNSVHQSPLQSPYRHTPQTLHHHRSPQRQSTLQRRSTLEVNRGNNRSPKGL